MFNLRILPQDHFVIHYGLFSTCMYKNEGGGGCAEIQNKCQGTMTKGHGMTTKQ